MQKASKQRRSFADHSIMAKAGSLNHGEALLITRDVPDSTSDSKLVGKQLVSEEMMQELLPSEPASTAKPPESAGPLFRSLKPSGNIHPS